MMHRGPGGSLVLRRILSSCVGATCVVVTTVLAMLHRGLGGSLMFHYTFTLFSVASQMISHSPSRVTSVWRLQAEKHRSLLRYKALEVCCIMLYGLLQAFYLPFFGSGQALSHMHSTSVSTKTARVQAEVTRVQAEGRTEAAVSGNRRASAKT